MSNEIFKWQPQLIDNDSATRFSTHKSEFETGAEQRRSRFGREVEIWRFNFDMVVIGVASAGASAVRIYDAIKAFHKARKGGYDNFWLPSWELEAKITASSGASTLTIAENPTDLGFSATAGDQGNYLYICDHFYIGFEAPAQLHEIKRISSISGSGPYTITIEGTFTNSYVIGANLQKAFKVFFLNDELIRGKDIPYIFQYPIEFKEDIADLYTQVSEL